MLHNMLRAAAGRDRIPTDGLVAHYTMDNISGSTLVDEMGNNDATITGATQTTGAIGQSLSFDGNDYVSTPYSFSTQSKSVSVWFKTSASGIQQTIICDADSTGTSSSIRILLMIRSSNDFAYGVGNSSINYLNIAAASATPYQNGVWHHAAIVYGGTSISLYVNDSLIASNTHSVSFVAPERSSTIGRLGDYNGWYWPGQLDQVRIYESELSSSDVSLLYNEGA